MQSHRDPDHTTCCLPWGAFLSRNGHSFISWVYVSFYLCIWNSYRISPVSLASCTTVSQFANLSHSYSQSVDSLRARTAPEIPRCHGGALRIAGAQSRFSIWSESPQRPHSLETILLRHSRMQVLFQSLRGRFCSLCVPNFSPGGGGAPILFCWDSCSWCLLSQHHCRQHTFLVKAAGFEWHMK